MFVRKEPSVDAYPDVTPLIPVPVIDQHAPAGFPEMPLDHEYIIDQIYVPDIPKGSMATKVKGNSMAPTIKDGEYIVFLPIEKKQVKNGDVIIVMNEWNELMVKRYREKEGKVYLTSGNPEYPTVEPNEQYKLSAKVIKNVRI